MDVFTLAHMNDSAMTPMDGALDTEIRLARVPPSQIGFINGIIEGYEGVGMVRTRDPKMGIVEFWIIPCFREVFLQVIESLRQEMDIVWIPRSERDHTFGVVDGVGYKPGEGGRIRR